MLNIVLRTVCGCERILEIPFTTPPPTFSVPYVRHERFWATAKDGESCLSQLENRRVFEFTHETGIYGYWLYLEKLAAPPSQEPSR